MQVIIAATVLLAVITTFAAGAPKPSGFGARLLEQIIEADEGNGHIAQEMIEIASEICPFYVKCVARILPVIQGASDNVISQVVDTGNKKLVFLCQAIQTEYYVEDCPIRLETVQKFSELTQKFRELVWS